MFFRVINGFFAVLSSLHLVLCYLTCQPEQFYVSFAFFTIRFFVIYGLNNIQPESDDFAEHYANNIDIEVKRDCNL